MPTGTLSVSCTVGGVTTQSVVSRTADSSKIHQVTCALAHAGVLTTRTNNTDGVITLTAGHGLATGTFDVFWDGGSRFGVSHTIVTNADTITGGSGDNLPIATTAVTVAARTEIASTFDGDNLSVLMLSATGAKANFQFTQSDGTTELLRKLVLAAESYPWWSGLATVPITGNAVGKIFVAGGDVTTAAVVTVQAILDETP